ncbi:YciI family protein [Neobacillus terrae]|uniref:YciI family protein n=1 Tax=Neobacillus terrae TaxID=3034837 RepID=UPI00140D9473|nr:YciI family protein [Neobacillus terrae]NHM34002.1 hypothetical protein [Neobacillus terrae]
MEKKQFLATAKPRTENFLQNMSEEEKAVFDKHFVYVNQMFSEGKILFSGACLDGTMGIICYLAESYEDALEMFKNDPLVQSDIGETQLHPFKTGHLQNIDIS